MIIHDQGLHHLDVSVPDPASCSTRRCEVQAGLVHAAWVTTKLFPGCGCCMVEGKMVPDGFSWTVGTYRVETFECCKGEVVRVTKPVMG